MATNYNNPPKNPYNAGTPNPNTSNQVNPYYNNQSTLNDTNQSYPSLSYDKKESLVQGAQGNQGGQGNQGYQGQPPAQGYNQPTPQGGNYSNVPPTDGHVPAEIQNHPKVHEIQQILSQRCPKCGSEASYPRRKAGCAAWSWCACLFCFTGCCFWIPFVIDRCYDVEAVCSSCGAVIDVVEATGC